MIPAAAEEKKIDSKIKKEPAAKQTKSNTAEKANEITSEKEPAVNQAKPVSFELKNVGNTSKKEKTVKSVTPATDEEKKTKIKI